ncbi:MAG: uridine kinase [Desulforhopalus sp.]|nr:uridine kinase [Desulforhopalus sp.]
MKKRFVLGICGGSGSGKTYIVNKIVQQLPHGSVSVLDQDSYYKDLSDLPENVRELVDFDLPDSIEIDLFARDLNSLATGYPIQKPQYDFTTHTRKHRTVPVASSPIIIIEGLHVLYHEQLLEVIDHKVYLDVDMDIRFIRRLVRDVRERGRSVDGVVRQYLDSVRPMDVRYVQPSKEKSHMTITEENFDSMFLGLMELLLGKLKVII